MSDEKIMRLRKGLLDSADMSTTAWVYLPADKNWNLNSKCAILEREEVPPESEDDTNAGLPGFANRTNLVQALPVTVVQDVVTNVRAQKPNATLEDLLRAFHYHYNHDVFLNLRT